MSFVSVRQRRRVMALLRAYKKYKDKPEHLIQTEGTDPEDNIRKAYTISESTLEDRLTELGSAVSSSGKGFNAPILEDGAVGRYVPPAIVKKGIDAIQRAAAQYDRSLFGDVVKGFIFRRSLHAKGTTAESSSVLASSYPSDIIDINVPKLNSWSFNQTDRYHELVAVGYDDPDGMWEHSVHHEIGHNIFRHLSQSHQRTILDPHLDPNPSFVAMLFSGGQPQYQSITEYGKQNEREWFAEHWAAYKKNPALVQKRFPVAHAFFVDLEAGKIPISKKGTQDTEGMQIMFHRPALPKWMQKETFGEKSGKKIPHSLMLEVLKIRKKRKPKTTN